MSNKASNWARVQNLHKTPKQVLTYLAERSNEKQGYHCFPRQSTIAAETGLSERTVWTALRYLEDMELIERERRNGKGGRRSSDTIYVLVSDSTPEAQPYGEWCRDRIKQRVAEMDLQTDVETPSEGYEHSEPYSQLVQANSQLVHDLLATVAEEPEREPEAGTSSTSSTSTSSTSSTSSSSAREALDEQLDLGERVLLSISQDLLKRIPEIGDDSVWQWYTDVLDKDFAPLPGPLRVANEKLRDGLVLEVVKRFGGVS